MLPNKEEMELYFLYRVVVGIEKGKIDKGVKTRGKKVEMLMKLKKKR